MKNISNTEARNFKLREGYASETSGGLLMCVDKDNVNKIQQEIG